MLAILLSGCWVDLSINNWLKQTLCVRYFTQFILVAFGNL